jgi:hypothetical protein
MAVATPSAVAVMLAVMAAVAVPVPVDVRPAHQRDQPVATRRIDPQLDRGAGLPAD